MTEASGPPGRGEAGRDGAELCGGCRERATCRMGVLDWATDHDASAVTCRVVCSAADSAGPGIAHGGWTAGVFDDVLGRLPRALGERAVTGSLSVVYRRPVPVEHELELRGRIVDRSGRRRTVEGDLRLAATGALLASATTVLVLVDDRHFPRHEQWLAAQAGLNGSTSSADADGGAVTVPDTYPGHMAAMGAAPPPAEPAWSAQRIAASLPAGLRDQFQREHVSFLALWQAKAQGAVGDRPEAPAAPAPDGATHKWGDLMDDWEL